MLVRYHLVIGFCRYSWMPLGYLVIGCCGYSRMPLGCVSSWMGGLDVGHEFIHVVSWVLWVFSDCPEV
jgi:hypothetical protein